MSSSERSTPASTPSTPSASSCKSFTVEDILRKDHTPSPATAFAEAAIAAAKAAAAIAAAAPAQQSSDDPQHPATAPDADPTTNATCDTEIKLEDEDSVKDGDMSSVQEMTVEQAIAATESIPVIRSLEPTPPLIE